MQPNRKYEFNWGLLGNIQEGRPILGQFTRLEVYRLMQFTFRDVMENRFGIKVADEEFCDAGYMAGKAFFEYFIGKIPDFSEFIRKLQMSLLDMGIGILRVEKQVWKVT